MVEIFLTIVKDNFKNMKLYIMVVRKGKLVKDGSKKR